MREKFSWTNDANEREKNNKVSRRKFLTLAGLGVSATASVYTGKSLADRIKRLTENSFITRTEESENDIVEYSEPHTEKWEMTRELTRDEIRELNAFIIECRNYYARVSHREWLENSCEASLRRQEELRREFLQTEITQRLDSAVEKIIIGKRDFILTDLLRIFSLFSCQGLLYATVERMAASYQQTVVLPHNRNYYAARIRDYVPIGKALWSCDIDPRNIHDAGPHMQRELATDIGWTGRRRKAAFRRLAERYDLIALAQNSDLTLSEYFSLLKAILHRQESGAAVDEREIANSLLAGREAFIRKRLLGPDTERALIFYGYDGENHLGSRDTTWNGTLAAAQVRPERTRIIGFSPGDDERRVVESFSREIASSRGKTFIAMDAHGCQTALQVNEHSDVILTFQILARALFDRVISSGDPNSLSEVTLCIEACYSHDFTRNLLHELKILWERGRFAQQALRFPNIIASAQENSITIHSFKMGPLLEEQTRGVQQDGGLFGARVLRNVQPIAYEHNDLTCFWPMGNEENSIEIGARPHRDNNAAV